MLKIKYITIALLIASGSISQVLADQVVVPVGSQVAESTIERPARGMTGDEVIGLFGEPLSSTETVGDPPITSWQYENFSVYFEFDRVVHTVLKNSSN